MTDGYELAFVIGGLFLSLCAFSLIFGDNYLFRLGTAILSGAVSAYICVLLVENYFYPLIMNVVRGTNSVSAAQMLRAAAVGIGIILLFCRAYTGSKTGGRIVLTILLAISSAVMILGAAGGTIPAFVRSLAGQFRIASLNPEQRSDVWYWIRTVSVLVSAAAALLYTRHYDPGKKNRDRNSSGSLFGNLLMNKRFPV